MPPGSTAFVVLLAACVAIGAAGTAWARRYALRHALLDAPGERRAHTVPTPRGGGIAIVVATLLAGLVLARQGGAFATVMQGTLPGLALVAFVGWRDDLRPLSPWLRLVVHAIASLLLAWAAWRAFGTPWSALLAFGLGVALTNIWNFMDGIDGIAATQAVLACVAVVLAGAGGFAAWAACLAAATLGFLPFNVPKARIFLGDVGSGALGFAIAALLVGAVGEDGPVPSIAWSLPISAFAIDATLTLGRRLVRGERWWQPHAQHAYQAWARRSGRHLPATLGYAGWTIAAIMLQRVLADAPMATVILSCSAWYIAGALAWWWLQRPAMQGKAPAEAKETRP